MGRKFLSTPSARRATPRKHRTRQAVYISIHALREEGDTNLYRLLSRGVYISIHALREEGDPYVSGSAARRTYFYPRPPRGGRHLGAVIQIYLSLFLSTPSARRATLQHCTLIQHNHHFYPRPPRGGRRGVFVVYSVCKDFYPRPPRGGRQDNSPR